jgi:hypothetical protein
MARLCAMAPLTAERSKGQQDFATNIGKIRIEEEAPQEVR